MRAQHRRTRIRLSSREKLVLALYRSIRHRDRVNVDGFLGFGWNNVSRDSDRSQRFIGQLAALDATSTRVDLLHQFAEAGSMIAGIVRRPANWGWWRTDARFKTGAEVGR